jgi:hypothetical protein
MVLVCASDLFKGRQPEKRIMTAGRFPPPWPVEDIDAALVVKDSAGQKLAYVYFEDKPGRRSAAKLLSKDEARRIAANIAMLPDLIGDKAKPSAGNLRKHANCVPDHAVGAIRTSSPCRRRDPSLYFSKRRAGHLGRNSPPPRTNLMS